MRKEKKVIYYSDELKDEFAGVSRSGYEVPKKYKYVHKNIFWRALAFFVYRVIMTPIAFLYCKIKLKLKIVDRTKKKRKDEGGCFLYANHTLLIGDAFIPSLLMFPKKTYVVVNSENLSTFGDQKFSLHERCAPDTEVAVCLQKIYGRNRKADFAGKLCHDIS